MEEGPATMANGHSNDHHRQFPTDAATTIDAAPDGGTLLEVEEQAGGPPLPAAGLAGAATKPSIEALVEQGQGREGENISSATTTATAADQLAGSAGGGDAAMAVVDDRLDPASNQDTLAHTNGYTEASESANGEIVHHADAVDYTKVANLTGGLVEGQQEQIPPVSTDIDQPARLEENPEAQGEAILPPQVEAVADENQPQVSAIEEDSQDLSLPVHGQAEVTSAIQGGDEQQPPLTPSLDSLPQDPAPLPSQLVNHTVPSTDATLSSAYPPAEPSQEEASATVPVSEPVANFDQPSSLPPKRPFEPDTSINEAAFSEHLDTQDSKRQKLEGDEQTQGEADVLDPSFSQPQPPVEQDQPAQPTQPTQQDDHAPLSSSLQPEDVKMQVQEEQVVGQGSFQTEGSGENDVDAQASPDVDPKMENDESIIDQSLTGIDDSAVLDGTLPTPSTSTSTVPPNASTSDLPGQADPSIPQQPQESPAPPPGLPKEQSKYALAILRTLKKKSEAAPFTHPVDPIALGIPHYTQIISQPMDLSTVEKKLQTNGYKAIEDFYSDIRLIWNNCYTFNGQEAGISKWAQTLSTLFEKQIGKMPSLASIQAQHAAAAAAKAAAREAAAAAKRSESPNAYKKDKARRSSAISGPKPDGKGQFDAGVFGGQPGPSTLGGQVPPPGKPGPKKGSKKNQQQSISGIQGMPGMSQQAMYQLQQLQQMQQLQQQQQQQQAQAQAHQQALANLNNDQLKFCKEVIKELFKKTHQSIAYAFYDPVDYVALGIPDYPKIIRRPMDLGTMKRKLEAGQYPNAAAFENDFKLLINNCFTYNPPMTPVHKMGEQLQAIFYDKWQGLPQLEEQPQGQWTKFDQSGYYGGEQESDGGYENEQINLMQRQLELLTGNLEMLKSKAMLKAAGRGMPFAGGMPSMGMNPMGMNMGMGMPSMAPPQAPKQRAPPAPKPPKQPAKRKSSGGPVANSNPYGTAVVTSASPTVTTTPSVPKPRTTKRSSMAARDTPYVPTPPRGSNGGSALRDDDDDDDDYYDDEPDDLPAIETSSSATVTFDMKKELAEKIQEFDGNKLDKVVEIIRSSAPELLGDDNKEIELDIDMLDQRTLLKLYEYVVHPVGKGRQLKPKKNKVKGRNRGVDEVAEEERINALQAQLDAMEGNVAAAQAAAAGPGGQSIPSPTAPGGDLSGSVPPQARGDVASSSSEDEDDGSDSDSDDGFDPNAA